MTRLAILSGLAALTLGIGFSASAAAPSQDDDLDSQLDGRSVQAAPHNGSDGVLSSRFSGRSTVSAVPNAATSAAPSGVVSNRFSGGGRTDDWRRRDDWDRGRFDDRRFERVTCRARRDGFGRCRVDFDFGDVRLINSFNGRRCRRGVDWGVGRGGIWVENGCSAVFAVYPRGGRRFDDRWDDRRRYDDRWDDRRRFDDRRDIGRRFDRNGDGLITCETRSQNRRFCAVPPQTRNVRLVNQRSRASCRKGRDWDFIGDGIWVQNGCRADFALVFDGGRRRAGW